MSVSKQPVAFRGQDDTAVAGEDPAFVTDHLEVQNGQFFFIPPVDYAWNVPIIDEGEQEGTTHAIYYPVTHILRVKLRALPTGAAVYEPIYSFISDKKVEIQISGEGKLRVYGDNSHHFEVKGVTLGANQWYYMKIMYGRGSYKSMFYDCGVHIEVKGVGEFGSDFNCK